MKSHAYNDLNIKNVEDSNCICYFFLYYFFSYLFIWKDFSSYLILPFFESYLNSPSTIFFLIFFEHQDADIVWLQNPFQHFDPDADFQIACDKFSGNSFNLRNEPNGGFNYVKSNNRTIEFYKFWYNSRKIFPGLHDQDVLNKIKFDPYIQKIRLKIRFLDTKYIAGFCQVSQDFTAVCTMHANCCFGLEAKITDLRLTLEDWRNFMELPPDQKSLPRSWSVPKKCRYFSIISCSELLTNKLNYVSICLVCFHCSKYRFVLWTCTYTALYILHILLYMRYHSSNIHIVKYVHVSYGLALGLGLKLRRSLQCCKLFFFFFTILHCYKNSFTMLWISSWI